jgi:hypothetical protein
MPVLLRSPEQANHDRGVFRLKNPLQKARSLIYIGFHSGFNLRLVNADAFTWLRPHGSQPFTEEKKD